MKVTLTPDKQNIYIQECTDMEKLQLQLSLKVRIKNHWNHPLVKSKKWDGYFNYLKNDRYIPVGLWKIVIDICNEYGYDINTDFLEDIIDVNIKRENVQAYFDDFFKDHQITPRDYQIDSVYMFSKYRKMVAEIATSSGKTLIIFMYFRYLQKLFMDAGVRFKMLVIVPKISLVIQTFEEWQDYNKGHEDIKIMMVSGNDVSHKKKTPEEYDVVIGTYQSLVNKSDDFFLYFRCILVDESHHTGAKSIKGIVTKCTNSVYKIGLSGTTGIDGDDAESYGIQEQLGPLLYHVSPDHLIKNNYATPVHVRRYVLNYIKDEYREKLGDLNSRKNFDKNKLLKVEREIAIGSKKRLKFIVDLILKTKKNALVLFASVEKGYGKIVKDAIREVSTDKDVFYVDGATTADNRTIYKKMMEDGENKVLVASFGTFSEGISIKNLHYVFLIESFKSEKIIKQSIGRGMRKVKGKSKVYIIDIVDDFREYKEDLSGNRKLKFKTKANYLFNHGKKRMEIYKAEGFPVKSKKVNL